MLRERYKQRTCEADSIEALPRGGQARSSDEAAVMAAELLLIGVEKHQAAFSSGTWLTGTPLTYLAPW